jgi:Tol biopolymer transport system component/tRNA A-37 threonylcarbamoyl transferase component Bud32
VELAPGTRLGPYEVASALGAGGMGQVYKARDTRLDRTVAIKILPESLARDPGFRERFEREARLIAQVDHPHICTVYDVGQQQDTAYLVMQFLEGETLARRLERGPLSRADAIAYAVQIADALAVAHRAGIVHRDVKPANIMLTKSGATLLDFGLAKAAPVVDVAQRDTSALTTPPQVTTAGTVMGTLHYLSPEQLEGRDADVRSDVWAFGCVLYETLAGAQPFRGRSAASLFANILHSEPPPVDALRANEVLAHVVDRALQKEPDARWQSMVDIAHELRWAAAHDRPVAASAPVAWHRRTVYVALCAAAAVAVAIALLARDRPPAPQAPLKLTVLPPAGVTFTPFASSGTPHFSLSPDGTRIAFIGSRAGEPPTLWIKRLDSGSGQQLPGTRDAMSPFWFPDGQTVGFFAEGALRLVRLDGDRAVTLARVLDHAGGTSNGEVILIGQNTGPILRTSTRGEAPKALAVADEISGGHRWPQFVSDNRRFIYTEARRSVKLGSLDSDVTTELIGDRRTAVFASPATLLSWDGLGAILAQPVDAASLLPVGPAREFLDDVAYAAGSGYPPVSTSSRVLAYWDGTTVETQFEWFNRAGELLAMLPTPPAADFAISPDGKRVAYSQLAGSKGVRTIWLLDENGQASRVSFAADAAQWPLWSADGRQLLYATRGRGAYALFSRTMNSTEQETRLATFSVGGGVAGAGAGDGRVTDWSSDGRTVLLQAGGLATSWDIYAVAVDSGHVTPLRQTAAYEIQPRFSPDAKWIAYASNETGRWEVFVEPFPATGRRSQVSRDGGSQPVWRRDGSELFFVAPDGKIMSAELTRGTTLPASPAKPLFQTRMRPTYPPFPPNYDVSPDGQRFLVEGVRPDTGPVITVIVDWMFPR